MFETTVQLKPRDLWRPGKTPDKLVDKPSQAAQLLRLFNLWLPPMCKRIDTLASGVKRLRRHGQR